MSISVKGFDFCLGAFCQNAKTTQISLRDNSDDLRMKIFESDFKIRNPKSRQLSPDLRIHTILLLACTPQQRYVATFDNKIRVNLKTFENIEGFKSVLCSQLILKLIGIRKNLLPNCRILLTISSYVNEEGEVGFEFSPVSETLSLEKTSLTLPFKA